MRRYWLALVLAVGFTALLLLGGCGVRTIYAPDGTPVRLRETVEDVKVWVRDADGNTVAGVMDLPEGV